ncbi:fumarate hydratase [Brevibacillus fluminis]|uniref:Fumarate hydratase class I n=1 Tax=Brevibacillus fluminis TaxID=511487 RepID=A0A3M8DBT8_9BACL|nr:fumarate hydratase [Brevibacillus fluminis]RNB85089.1 fumarate hydratase [Brevibacillus fluminis]
MEKFRESMLALITETSTYLPPDVRVAINAAKQNEDAGTRSALSLATIAENIVMAEENVSPICQDTGMPTFEIKTPVGANQIEMKKAILEAVVEATKTGKLRPNSVDSLTGENSGNNLGAGTPVIHFEQWEKDYAEVKLILKGGGCENKNIQYSLPAELEGLGKAGRDLDGIRKCILHAVYQAQGQGCSAGFIGVGIGGDRTSGYALAKHQLFRRVDDVNPNEDLAKLEAYIMENANKLGIGTMGFGGNTTLLGCKIGVENRLPASFFVSVAYNCWAFRRQGVQVDVNTGEIIKYVYKDEVVKMDQAAPVAATEDEEPREIVLQAPISEEQIRSLKVGDVVIINGEMHTGRDALHKYLMDHDCPVDLNGGVIYHCGPVMLKDREGEWHVKAAGPTTSIREEPYQGDIIKKFGIRAVIGKGGMGAKTLKALGEHGAVYLNAIGGAAQYYARCMEKVEGVDFMEFGIPEAMWHLRVKGFAAIVTMDSHGNSLHADVEKTSKERLADFAEPVFK